ncbi:DUF6188 family protein [Paraglaciecola sp. 25GB23A]|uniref:DUF6188 family protein n=1 Tax=Paraglaciecola sp. 25GB23A TaxID=3156068 RepID=UPI0032AE8F18
MSSIDVNEFARKMIGNSFVYKVGLESGFPFIIFLNSENDERVSLRINGDFRLLPELVLPNNLSADHKEYIMLLELHVEAIESLICADNGDLTITFESGRQLWVEGFPNDSGIYEPWLLFNTGNQAQLICQRGGDYAFVQGN